MVIYTLDNCQLFGMYGFLQKSIKNATLALEYIFCNVLYVLLIISETFQLYSKNWKQNKSHAYCFFSQMNWLDSFILITYRHMSKLIFLKIKKNLILGELRASLPIWKHKELQENNGINIKLSTLKFSSLRSRISLPTPFFKSHASCLN